MNHDGRVGLLSGPAGFLIQMHSTVGVSPSTTRKFVHSSETPYQIESRHVIYFSGHIVSSAFQLQLGVDTRISGLQGFARAFCQDVVVY